LLACNRRVVSISHASIMEPDAMTGVERRRAAINDLPWLLSWRKRRLPGRVIIEVTFVRPVASS